MLRDTVILQSTPSTFSFEIFRTTHTTKFIKRRSDHVLGNPQVIRDTRSRTNT
jgi:hypothetical protein